MQILEDLNIAAGLEWELYESVKLANESLKKQKNAYFARKSIGEDCIQGRTTTAQKKRGLMAGALLVAAAESNALVFHPVGDGKFWVCAIRDGIPLNGFDIVAPEEEARTMLTEAMSYVQGVKIFGDIPGATSSVKELINSVSVREAKKCLMTTRTSGIIPILAGVFLFVAMAGSLFAVSIMIDRASKEKNAIDALMEQMKNKEELARIKAERQRTFDAKVAAAKKTYWYSASPPGQFDLWMETLRAIPVSFEGWKPIDATCSVTECKLRWMRTSARALPSAAKRLPGRLVQGTPGETVTIINIPQLETITWGSGIHADVLLDIAAANSLAKQATLVVSEQFQVISVASDDQEIPSMNIGKSAIWSLSSANHMYARAFLEKLQLPGLRLTEAKFSRMKSGVPEAIDLSGEYRAE